MPRLAELVGPPPPTDVEIAKWRAHFESMGREAVRHAVNFHPGTINPRRKLAVAQQWLREQEIEAEKRERDVAWYVKWTWDAALAAAILAAVGIIVAIVLASQSSAP